MRASSLRHALDGLAWSGFLLVTGCGGGGGRSPTAVGPLDVAGSWAAVETIASASPAGNCWADQLNLLHGFSGDYTVTVDQAGTMVTLEVDANDFPTDRTAYEGAVDSSSLAANETRGVPESDFTCGSGQAFHIRDVSGHVDVSGTSRRLSGTLAETFGLTDRTSGADAGQVTINYTFVMTR